MIELLMQLGETLNQTAVTYAMMLIGISEQMEAIRKQIVDTAVGANQEAAKRDAVALLRSRVDELRVAADMIERGPMDAKDLASNICESLRLRFDEHHICQERANNIAAAYQGRVAMEPK